MIADLIFKNRSYRKFDESYKISRDKLVSFVDLARLSPCAGNRQLLKFFISSDSETNGKIFTTLKWAAYLTDYTGPAEGERPSAYIVVLHDKNIHPSVDCDHGIAAQSILLGAKEDGLGGCIIASINKPVLRAALNLPENLEILLVLALGKPTERIEIEDVKENGDIKYFRTADGVHHVPKRKIEDLIVNI